MTWGLIDDIVNTDRVATEHARDVGEIRTCRNVPLGRNAASPWVKPTIPRIDTVNTVVMWITSVLTKGTVHDDKRACVPTDLVTVVTLCHTCSVQR